MQQTPGIQLDTVNVAGAASGVAGGPDFSTKGSGGVTYLVDGATTTDNSYGSVQRRPGPAERRHEHCSSTSTRSIRSTSPPEARSSTCRQPGDDDQRRDEARHQRAQGLGPATSTPPTEWQSDNTAAGGDRPGLRDEQHALHPRVRRRDRGPDHQGRLWIWARGSRQDIALNLTGTNPEGDPIVSDVEAAALDGQDRTPRSSPLERARPSTISTATASRPGVGNWPTLSAARRLDEISTSRPTSTSSTTTTSSPRTCSRSCFLSYQYPHYDIIPARGPNGTDDLRDVDGVYHNGCLLLTTEESAVPGERRRSRSSSTRARSTTS